MCSDIENEVPTTAEELNRKTVEALAQMADGYEKVMMSEESFYQFLRAIDLVTSGLIDNDVSSWLSDNLKEHCQPRIERRVFRAGTKVTVVLTRIVTEDYFTMIQMAAGAEDKGRFITAFTDGSFCPDTSAFGCSYWIRNGEEQPITSSKGGVGIANCEIAEIEALNGAIDWIHSNCQLENRIVVLQSDSLGALRKCNFFKLKKKAQYVKLKHVKGHKNNGTRRTWVNKLCDKMAKDQMLSYRQQVNEQRGQSNG